MTDLPDGWAMTTLGQLGKYLNGRGFKKSEWSDSGWPIIRIQNLTRAGGGFNYYSGPIEDRYKVANGDFLISWAATLGAFIWRGPEAVLNQHIFKVESYIEKKFHYYLVQHLLDDLMRSTHGSGMVHVTRQRFDGQPVRLPPLPEQRRIVAALEEHLARIMSSQQGVRRSVKRLDVLQRSLRQVVLCGGNPPPERLPHGWRWGKLRDVIDGVDAGRSFACHPRPARADEWGVVKVSAMTWGTFRPHENKAVPVDCPINEAHRIGSGDLLISRANTEAYVGAPVIVRDIQSNLLLSDKSLRLRMTAGIDKEWLLQILSSPFVRRQVSKRATGTKDSMRNISQKALLDVDIPIPPPGQQTVIASWLSEQLEGLKRMEAELGAVLIQGDLLRAGLFQAAFDGQLVPQDPNDEQASELLARIRAERAAAPPKQKTPSRRTRKELAAPPTRVTGDDYQQEALPL
ncbi:restriction endonuclease subunit S [Micromonospora profundi]|uniref:Restriction endonuclease subunit S n=1 Tax=Micromonospora profundi TaxID=1420889 RepID=A0AAJ6HQ86_9ACTN|nr:restriction endonuclease subunit S [Micromonospora profundi]WLS42993.1 restriction endonuclease subunit S [Micromonospora profundi]